MICLHQLEASVSPLDLAATLNVPGLPDALAPVLPSPALRLLTLISGHSALASLRSVNIVTVTLAAAKVTHTLLPFPQTQGEAPALSD